MRGARRSRLIALGLSVGVAGGLVAGMVASARPQPPVVAPVIEAEGAEPVAAEPPANPFAGQRAVTETGAS